MTKPNILLIIIDSARAKNTSVYGHHNETTPFLEQFAERSTVYHQARASGVWSLPSHTSIFTGYHVAEHGIIHWDWKLAPGYTIWEELINKHDYSAGSFSTNRFVIDEQFGLTRGFNTIETGDLLPHPDAIDPRNYLDSESAWLLEFVNDAVQKRTLTKSLINSACLKFNLTNHGHVMDAFLNWALDSEEPWAACVNLMDAHIPYEPASHFDQWGTKTGRRLQDEIDDHRYDFSCGRYPPKKRKELECLYDSTIYQTDRWIKQILTQLEEASMIDNTLVVVTSDHGEGFGEQSRVRSDFNVCEHQIGVHESLLHVPLIVKYPGQTDGSDIRELATNVHFPAAVRAVLDSTTAPEDVFVSSDRLPVTATTDKLRGAPSDCNADELEKPARIVYEQADNGVKKYAKWGDSTATIFVDNAQSASKLSRRGGEVVDEVFDQFSIVDAKVKPGEEVPEATRNHLERLGYL